MSRRKRTATERAESNGDPLIVRKKAREAANRSIATQPAALKKTVPAGNNRPQVSFFFVLENIYILH